MHTRSSAPPSEFVFTYVFSSYLAPCLALLRFEDPEEQDLTRERAKLWLDDLALVVEDMTSPKIGVSKNVVVIMALEFVCCWQYHI